MNLTPVSGNALPALSSPCAPTARRIVGARSEAQKIPIRLGPARAGRGGALATEVVSVDSELEWLVDRTRIRDLTARYNRCFDDGDTDGFAATFTEDGVMEVVGGFEVRGHDGLAEMCRRTPYGVVHVTVDATVEIDGDRAVQDVTVMVLQRPKPDAAPDERRTTLERTGRYHDDLVRTADGWRFARRSVTLDGGM